jgi:hypothetical protein
LPLSETMSSFDILSAYDYSVFLKVLLHFNILLLAVLIMVTLAELIHWTQSQVNLAKARQAAVDPPFSYECKISRGHMYSSEL